MILSHFSALLISVHQLQYFVDFIKSFQHAKLLIMLYFLVVLFVVLVFCWLVLFYDSPSSSPVTMEGSGPGRKEVKDCAQQGGELELRWDCTWNSRRAVVLRSAVGAVLWVVVAVPGFQRVDRWDCVVIRDILWGCGKMKQETWALYPEQNFSDFRLSCRALQFTWITDVKILKF